MKGGRYREMAERTRALGTDWIAWLPRDHGRIVWPPEPADPDPGK